MQSAACDGCFDGIPNGLGRPPQGSGSERETVRHGSEKGGGEQTRGRACEIFIMASCIVCCQHGIKAKPLAGSAVHSTPKYVKNLYRYKYKHIPIINCCSLYGSIRCGLLSQLIPFLCVVLSQLHNNKKDRTNKLDIQMIFKLVQTHCPK